MDYQAVKMPYIKHGQQTYRTYCLVDPVGWNLGVEPKRIVEILLGMKCKLLKVNLLEVLRGTVGTAKYVRGATIHQAPNYFDCSTLVCWSFALIGVQMPRYAIEQAKQGAVTALINARLGDLVFCKGKIPRIDEDVPNGVGHVAIATGRGTVIHAKNRQVGVIEEPIGSICANLSKFRGVKRILSTRGWFTVIVPNDLKISYSFDLRWKVGSKLKR